MFTCNEREREACGHRNVRAAIELNVYHSGRRSQQRYQCRIVYSVRKGLSDSEISVVHLILSKDCALNLQIRHLMALKKDSTLQGDQSGRCLLLTLAW